MNTKSRYKPKKLKFSGEESFMVPKEGEKFVLAVGADVVALDKQNIENVDVAPLEPTSVTNPNVVTTPQVQTPPPVVIPVPDWQSMDCATIQAEVRNLEEMLTYSKFSSEVLNQYLAIIQSGKDTFASKCGGGQVLPPDEVPPAPPVIPEPNWSSLSCDSILQEITELQNMYQRGPKKLGQDNYENIPSYIQNGKKYYEDNCINKQTAGGIVPPKETITTTTSGGVGAPPVTTITTTGTPIIATASTGGLGLPKVGGFGGGSGGGGGAKEEPKKAFSWWWLLFIAGGVYLLTRKK